jgi:hypothetical protein
MDRSYFTFELIPVKYGILKHYDKETEEGEDFKEYFSSAKLDSQGVILKGEYYYGDGQIVFVGVYGFNKTTPIAYLKTSNLKKVYTIKVVERQNEEFILVSGDCGVLDIFQFKLSDSLEKTIGINNFLD